MTKNADPAKALELAQRGEPGVARLVEGLAKPGRISAICAWAIAQHPHPVASEALRNRLWAADQVSAYWAARALGKLPDPQNVESLSALLPDKPGWFWELSSGGKPRTQDVWDAQGRRSTAVAPADMPNLRVAYAAMEALGELGGERAASTLMRALTNSQYLIRYGAARGLGRMRHVPALAALQQLAEHDPVLLARRGAQQAVGLIRDANAAMDCLKTSPLWLPEFKGAEPSLPASLVFIKTRHRSDATFGFRDSYFFPKTPRYHSGENIFSLTPPRPDGALKNLTQLSNGEVQGAEISLDGSKLLFAMRRDKTRDGFHIFEMNTDGSGLRQLTSGNCNDVDPCYLPDGRIAFCSDRCGWQEYYHQERSRVLYVMNADGSDIRQITFNPNEDYEPVALRDGRVLYSSYRFYAQDGSEGPLPGEFMGLARIETVLRVCNPDGAADQPFYGSMRGSFYCPLRPMPFGDQFAGWHKRGYHVGVSVSLQRETPDGLILCTSPAGLTIVDPSLSPNDCELPLYPEVLNLAGGEEVYIHNYDDMNPVGRYTSPYPLDDQWVFVSHAPWHDLRVNGYGLYLMNIVTRELRLVYDDRQMSDVDPVPVSPRSQPLTRSTLTGNTKTPSPLAGHSNDNAGRGAETGRILCNSVFNTDIPFDKSVARYVRVLEGVQMGQSIAANAAFRTRLLATIPLHEDGSFYVEVPADTPVRFELLDADGRMLVHETEFNSVRAGETKGCVGCHEPRHEATPNLHPLALREAPAKATRNRGDLIYFGRRERPYNHVYRD